EHPNGAQAAAAKGKQDGGPTGAPDEQGGDAERRPEPEGAGEARAKPGQDRGPTESADAQRGEAERRPEPERERVASAKDRQDRRPTESLATPASFYGERIPAQFNRALDRQAAQGEAGRRVYEAMRAVDATIRVDVVGPGGGTYFLNIRAGRMTAEPRAAHDPFLTLI